MKFGFRFCKWSKKKKKNSDGASDLAPEYSRDIFGGCRRVLLLAVIAENMTNRVWQSRAYRHTT